MKFIDTHAHYDDEKFNEDRQQVLSDVKNAGIVAIINDSVNVKNSLEVVELARKNKNIFVAIGVHPTDDAEENYIEKLTEIYNKNKDIIVAIGEIGLDYYWEKDNKESQHKKFIEQVKLANKLELPIVIHCRDAGNDIVKLMENCIPKYGCVFHCYQPMDETLNFILKNDFYISLTGNITFKRNDYFYKVLEKVPVERIMVETDCPYMSPEPYRGKRNSSVNIPIIANKLAEIKGLDIETLSEVLYENSVKFYNLEKRLVD